MEDTLPLIGSRESINRIEQIFIALFRKTKFINELFIFNILSDLEPSWQKFMNNTG